jgi:cytochrome d ubiquinol oxidase subunit I
MELEALEIARWQFGITTVYHFFFVPITIGLSFLVAGMQTAWYRTGNEEWLRLTKFFGKLFLINFAMGVVTGIVQEFQFGMNWSTYSRFVGDIFGAPLAVEGLLAFFLESTFLGLWIFGWGRLSRGLHLATIWLAATGTLLSAYFILAANSWMQNPVGYEFNPETGRAELVNFAEVLLNRVTLVTFPHTITAAFMTAGGFVAGVALWRMARRPDIDRMTYKKAAKVGAITLLVAGAGVVVTGDVQAKIMTEVQPMKMAAAEAWYETGAPADFSVLSIGTLDGSEATEILAVPGLLSFLATGDWSAEVEGINDLQQQYVEQFGDLVPTQDYTPNIPIAYWTFRFMMGLGFAGMLIGAWILWAIRGPEAKGVGTGRWTATVAILLPFLPLLANSFGWIFTEMARQPWIVFGLMPTSLAVSPTVSAGEVMATMIGFTLLYGALAVVEIGLLMHYIKAGLPDVSRELADTDENDGERPLTFAY